MTAAEGGWEPGRAVARARATLVRWFPRLAINQALADAGIDGARASMGALRRYDGGAVEVACVVRPPATAARIGAAVPHLRTSLGVPVEVEPADYPRRVKMFLGTGAPPHRPYPWRPLHPVGVPLPPVDALPLGVDARGNTVSVAMWDKAGGRSLLVAGQPGAGKTNGVQVLLCGVVSTATTVVVLDPKGGHDYRPFGSRIHLVPDATDADVVLGVLDELVALIQQRSTQAVAPQPTLPMSRRVLLVVDEWADLASSDAKTRRLVDERMRTLLRMGRAFGLAIIAATQQPTSDSIDTTARGLMQARLSFALPNADAAKAAGVPGAEELHATRDRGVGLLDDGSAAPVRVRVHGLDADGLVSALCSGYQVPVSEVLAWERQGR